jgi:hypothetical protein
MTDEALERANAAEPGERLRRFQSVSRGACRRLPFENDPGRRTFCPDCLTLYDDYGKPVKPLAARDACLEDARVWHARYRRKRHRFERELLGAVPRAASERNTRDPRDYRGWRDCFSRLHHVARGVTSDWSDARRSSTGPCHVTTDRGYRRSLLHRQHRTRRPRANRRVRVGFVGDGPAAETRSSVTINAAGTSDSRARFRKSLRDYPVPNRTPRPKEHGRMETRRSHRNAHPPVERR